MARLARLHRRYQVLNTLPDAQFVIELGGAGGVPPKPEAAMQTVLPAFDPQAERSGTSLSSRPPFTPYSMASMSSSLRKTHSTLSRSVRSSPSSALLMTGRNRFSLPDMHVHDLALLP